MPSTPSVTALVACEAGGGDPLPTLVSLEAQRGVSLRSVLVAEPSVTLAGPGSALARADAVVTTPGDRAGREAAWAVGLAHAPHELILVTSAGAVLEPDFVRRAVVALVREPGLAWVTAFARTGDTPEHAPPGSYRLPLAELGASPSVALVRRSALETARPDEDAASYDESDLFVRMARAGAHGVVLQEPLIANLPRRAPVQR